MIFVGYADIYHPDQPDRYYTSFAGKDGVDLSGVEIIATAYANLLSPANIRPSATPYLSAGRRGVWSCCGDLGLYPAGNLGCAGSVYFHRVLCRIASVAIQRSLPLATARHSCAGAAVVSAADRTDRPISAQAPQGARQPECAIALNCIG